MAQILTDLSLRLRAQTSELKSGLKEASSSTKNFNKDVKSTSKSVDSSFKGMSKNAGGALQQMTGGLSAFGPAASSATGGLQSLAVGAKALNVAMGPIGVIIGAVALAVKALASYFTGSVEGASKFASIMGFIRGILDVISDAFVKLGRIIVSAFEDPKQAVADLWASIKQNLWNRWEGLINFFKGSFEFLKNGLYAIGNAVAGVFNKEKRAEAKKYWEEAKKGLVEMGDAALQVTSGLTKAERVKVGENIKAAYNDSIAKAKELQSLTEREFALKLRSAQAIKQIADLEKEISEQKLISADREGQSNEERLAANKKTQDLIKQKGAIEIELAKEAFNIQQRRNELTESSVEDVEAESQKYVTLLNTQKKVSDELREQVTQHAEINTQISAQTKTQQDKLKAEKAAFELRKQAAADYANSVIANQKKIAAEGGDPKERLNYELEVLSQSLTEQEEAVRNAYQNRLIDADKYYAALGAIDETYKAERKAAEEKYNEEILAAKQEQNALYVESYQTVMDALSNIFEAAKNYELKQAGDNAKKKEKIEKEYAKKQQAIAIIQAIVNTALGVSAALSTTPPASYVLAAVTAAAGAAQVALIASQSFADGGIVYGPTMGLVGEYPGAKSNPEVIAPLDKLQNMLSSTSGNVKFKIEGEDLVGVLNNNLQLSEMY